MTELEQLPARIGDLTSQVSHLRTEMRGEFSAVRGEVAEQLTALRAEMAEQGQGIIVILRGEMAEQGKSLRAEIRDLGNQMRVLHEDVIARLAQLQEGWPTPRKRKPRRG